MLQIRIALDLKMIVVPATATLPVSPTCYELTWKKFPDIYL